MQNADPQAALLDENAAASFCLHLRSALRGDPAITEKRMFGTTALCVGSKVFLLPWKGTLVLKLSAPQVDQLVASGEAVLFDPGHGRTNKTWAAVSVQARGQWERLAQDARVFVAG